MGSSPIYPSKLEFKCAHSYVPVKKREDFMSVISLVQCNVMFAAHVAHF